MDTYGSKEPFFQMLNGIWIIAAAFCIGRVSVMGLQPFAVAFFVAAYLSGNKIFLTYISIMFGIYTSNSIFNFFRYGVIMLGVVGVLHILKCNVKRYDYGFCLAAGAFVTILDMAVHYFYPENISIILSLVEGACIFSATCLFNYAIKIIRDDYVRIAIENEATISVILLFAIIFAGTPFHVGEIVIAETLGLLSIMFAYYKFGFGIGTSWTVVVGLIMSVRTNLSDYLTAWLVVAICAYAINLVFSGRRLSYTVIFGGIYYGLGVLNYSFLISFSGQKAIAASLFLFLLLPRAVLLSVDGRVISGEINEFSSEWGKLVLKKIESFALAIKRIDYTFAGEGTNGIGFRDVGNIIEDFTNRLEKEVPIRKTIEAKIVEELARKEVQVKNITLTKDSSGLYDIYISVRSRKRHIIAAEVVRKVVENNIEKKIVLKEESRAILGKNYETLSFCEKPSFVCKSAVRKMSRYEDKVSGDNFYLGNISPSQYLILLADGMGNGEMAALDSEGIIDVTEELLGAGFDKETSIRLVNMYLANKNRGERFTTLDMLVLDLHTGYGYMYKQGAATTFIRRNDWMEMVKSTSLPVGIIEHAECERCMKKFYDGNIIVMVSDGILESIIFENKEEYMRELIMECQDMTPEETVSYIVEQIKNLSGNRLKDDATVIVCQLVKTL